MRTVSPAEVERQIRREGARYGLFPLMQGDRCFVAQKQLQVTDGPDAVVGQLVEELVPICGVNMNAPLQNVWKSRKQRHEFDVAKVYREARVRREEARRRAAEDRSEQRARELERLARRFGTDVVALAQVRKIQRNVRRMQGR